MMKGALLFLAVLCSADATERVTSDLEKVRARLQHMNRDNLLVEVEDHAYRVFLDRADGLDLEAVVDQAWNNIAMGAYLNRAIERAVEEIDDQTELLTRLKSNFSKDIAEQLVARIIDEIQGSASFRHQLERLNLKVVRRLEPAMITLAGETAEGALLLMETYIEQRFAATMRDAWADQLALSVPEVRTARYEPGQTDLTLAGTGVAVVIGSRIGTIIMRRMGRKLTGQVFSKLIPVIGWALIAVDVVELWGGAFPAIERGLRDDLPRTFRQGYDQTLERMVREQAGQTAKITASRMYDAWLSFEKDYRDLIAAIEREPRLRDALETVARDRFPRLVALTAHLDDAALARSLEEGTLHAALLLPRSSYVVLDRGHDLDELLAWHTLAGDRLEAVIAREIYVHKTPDQLTETSLAVLLALESERQVGRLLTLPEADLTTLTSGISRRQLDRLADLDAESMINLAALIRGQDRTLTTALIRRIGDRPELGRRLSDPDVHRLLAGTSNPDRLIDFLEKPDGSLEMFGDSLTVMSGNVPIRAYLAKYGPGRSTLVSILIALAFGIPLLIAIRRVTAVFT